MSNPVAYVVTTHQPTITLMMHLDDIPLDAGAGMIARARHATPLPCRPQPTINSPVAVHDVGCPYALSTPEPIQNDGVQDCAL